jgi:hypothetical protein
VGLALASHCGVALEVARKRNAPKSAELSEVSGAVAGEAAPVAVAGVAIEGTGRAGSVDANCSDRARTRRRGLGALVVDQLEGTAAGRAESSRKAGSATRRALSSYSHVAFEVAGLRNAPRSAELPMILSGVAAAAVSVRKTFPAVEGARIADLIDRDCPLGTVDQTGSVDQVESTDTLSAVGEGRASIATSRALTSHSHVAFEITRERNAPSSVQLPVISSIIAAETVPVAAASVTVEATGRT